MTLYLFPARIGLSNLGGEYMLVFKTEKSTQKKVAIITGASIIVMAICAGFSYGFVHSSLIAKGDATATLSNISGSIDLFRAEILG